MVREMTMYGKKEEEVWREKRLGEVIKDSWLGKGE